MPAAGPMRGRRRGGRVGAPARRCRNLPDGAAIFAPLPHEKTEASRLCADIASRDERGWGPGRAAACTTAKCVAWCSVASVTCRACGLILLAVPRYRLQQEAFGRNCLARAGGVR